MFAYMLLATYIKDLLYRYECVIVPGFGALLAQHQSAHIDTDTHTFFPPGKTLSFNRQLQTNDGLLANHVASVDGCGYEEALQKIRNFIGRISLQLSEGETVSMPYIGEFSLNTEGSLQFLPSNKHNFSTSSFGLTSFVSASIEREVVPEIAVVEDPTPILFTPERRVQRPYLKYAAVGLIALMAAGFGGFSLYEGQVQKHNFVQKQKADSLLENEIQSATFVIENPLPAVDLYVAKETGKYHIMAGAFRIENNADKKVSQLVSKGYQAKRIGKNKYGLHQVIYSSHPDRITALGELRRIQHSENKDAWMLVQDLNL